MLDKQKNERISEFLDAIVNLHKDMNFSTFWPVNPAQLEASYSDLMALRFFDKYDKDPEKFKKSFADVKPNSIRSLLYQVGILGLKVANIRHTARIPHERLVDYALFLLEIAASKINGDEFSKDGFYRVLNESEVQDLMKNLNWVKILNKDESRKIAELGVILESLVWSLQYDTFRTAGTLIHGPYYIPNGTLIVKDFVKLKSLVWNNKMFADRISIYLIYKPGFNLRFNYANQQVGYSDSPIDSLNAFCIVSDGKRSNLNKIRVKYIEELGDEQVKHVNSLSKLDMVLKGAEIYGYMYKEFFDFYKENWKPTPQIYERINKGYQRYLDMYQEEGKIDPAFYRKQFDPRSDFIG